MTTDTTTRPGIAARLDTFTDSDGTAVALHPSEITFTCPLWCRMSREEHLADLGNHGGRLVHYSEDTGGRGDEVWAVSLSSMTYPDGTIVDGGEVMVEVDAHSVNLTLDQARVLVQAILTASAEAERA
jgi:hypothetical protein